MKFGLSFLTEILILLGTAFARKDNTKQPSILSFDLRPSAELSVKDESKRRLQVESNDWEYKHGVYGALEYFASDDNIEKEQFNKHRHLSRYEKHRQIQNRLLEQSNENEEEIHYLHSTSSNPYQLTPLYQGYGTHYASVWVGTPPQRKSVIVDTGSHYTAFPCAGCRNCGEDHHTDKYFDPNKSSTFKKLKCNECDSTKCRKGECFLTQGYTEGSSWSGYQANDRFFCGSGDEPDDAFDNSFAIKFTFGCQTAMKGLFVTQLADGIMGMSDHQSTLPQKMFDERKLEHNMFTMCFKRQLAVSKEGVTAGILTLGGIDTRLHDSPIVYAKNLAQKGWYTVNIKNIWLHKSVGGTDINVGIPFDKTQVNSGKGVIVDSGTTDTYLSKSLLKEFTNAWLKTTGMVFSHNELKLTQDDIQKLPTLLIQLEGYENIEEDEFLSMEQGAGNKVKGLVGDMDKSSPRDVLLAIPAEHFFEYSPSKSTYICRLYFNEFKGGVLGANAMLGHDIIFDREKRRIGFAESSCDYNEISEDLETNISIENLVPNNGAPPKPDEGADVSLDCILSPPTIIETCEDNIKEENLHDRCIGKDPGYMPAIYQKSIFVVQNPGSEQGKKCIHVMVAMKKNDSDVVSCNHEGTCSLVQLCNLNCKDVLKVETPAVIEPETTKETNTSLDCVLSPPTISSSCWESVGILGLADYCQTKDPALKPGAKQRTDFIIQRKQQQGGKSCHDTMLDIRKSSDDVVSCRIDSCYLIQHCPLTCQDILEKDPQTNIIISNGYIVEMNACKDEPWGACTLWCSQSRMHSELLPDGSCSVEKPQSRPCHIEACRSYNPCNVPFVVHTQIGLGGIDPNLWTDKHEEIFVEAFASSFGGIGNIGPGDVNILMSNMWNPNGEDTVLNNPNELGVKLTLEISIYREAEDANSNTGEVDEAVENIKSKISTSKISGHCSEEDLHIYAKKALDLQTKLQNPIFIPDLLDRLPFSNDDETPTAFDSAETPISLGNSRVITSWTIQTDNEFGEIHPKEASLLSTSNFTKDKLKSYLTDIPFMAALLVVILFIFSIGSYIGFRLDARRDYDLVHESGLHSSSLMSKMRQKNEVDRSNIGYSDDMQIDDYELDDVEIDDVNGEIEMS